MLAAFTVLLAGCESQKPRVDFNAEAMASKIPAFLVGPMSVLLTNEHGYSAFLTLEKPGSLDKKPMLSGQLLGQGNMLMFAPQGGDRIFVWNAYEHTGYVFSEALQGYAPFASTLRVTNLSAPSRPSGPAFSNINGHPGHEAIVETASNDGDTTKFELWCASDLNDFPVRLLKANAPEPYIINLSKFRLETVKPDIFLPPEDFTKYTSPQAITDELVVRKLNATPRQAAHTPSLDEQSRPTPAVH
jgi:hypothetical protein